MENITKNLQFVLLTIILISTIIAVGIEIKTMFINQSVTCSNSKCMLCGMWALPLGVPHQCSLACYPELLPSSCNRSLFNNFVLCVSILSTLSVSFSIFSKTFSKSEFVFVYGRILLPIIVESVNWPNLVFVYGQLITTL